MVCRLVKARARRGWNSYPSRHQTRLKRLAHARPRARLNARGGSLDHEATDDYIFDLLAMLAAAVREG